MWLDCLQYVERRRNKQVTSGVVHKPARLEIMSVDEITASLSPLEKQLLNRAKCLMQQFKSDLSEVRPKPNPKKSATLAVSVDEKKQNGIVNQIRSYSEMVPLLPVFRITLRWIIRIAVAVTLWITRIIVVSLNAVVTVNVRGSCRTRKRLPRRRRR